MKSRYLYLFIDLFCLSLPLLASFYPKAPFYKKWLAVALAILIPGIIFILWDELFTQLGIWGFNPMYITGVRFGSLPLEEILFFVCVPYACLFTYFAMKYLGTNKFFFRSHELLSYGLVVLLLIAGIYQIDKFYTASTFLALAFYLAFLALKVRARFLGHFYVAFLFILIPFFVVNGLLTGSFIKEEVVWYNDEATMGIRLGTIPLEDVFYAMLLLVMNVSIFEWVQGRR